MHLSVCRTVCAHACVCSHFPCFPEYCASKLWTKPTLHPHQTKCCPTGELKRAFGASKVIEESESGFTASQKFSALCRSCSQLQKLQLMRQRLETASAFKQTECVLNQECSGRSKGDFSTSVCNRLLSGAMFSTAVNQQVKDCGEKDVLIPRKMIMQELSDSKHESFSPSLTYKLPKSTQITAACFPF